MPNIESNPPGQRMAALPNPAQVHRIRDDAEAIAVAHRLADDFAPGAAERDHERRLPWDELASWSLSGLGGITVPARFGGADVSFETLAEVFVILSTADPALAQIPQNHFALLGLLREAGSPRQQRRFFGEALTGRRLGNAGPERASATSPNVLQGTTRLTSTAAGLRLNGRRFYATGALFAHRIPARAVDEQGRAVHVWVARDADGVTVIDDWSSFGQRTTASGSVTFENVPVHVDEVLPIWQLTDRPGLSGPVSQLIQAAIDQGIAEAASADAIRFVREYARPWVDAGVQNAGDDPHLIQDVGRLQVDLHAAYEVLREAAHTLDLLKREPISQDVSARASVAVATAKVLTTEVALAASERLFELAGSSSTRAKHHLDRHWRNARTHTLHDPVRWKTHLIGNFLLNGIAPNRHSWN